MKGRWKVLNYLLYILNILAQVREAAYDIINRKKKIIEKNSYTPHALANSIYRSKYFVAHNSQKRVTVVKYYQFLLCTCSTDANLLKLLNSYELTSFLTLQKKSSFVLKNYLQVILCQSIRRSILFIFRLIHKIGIYSYRPDI